MWDFLMWMYNFSRYILVGLNSCYWSSIYFTCLFHTFCIFWLDIGISIPSNFAHTKVKLLPSFVEYYMFICIRNVSFLNILYILMQDVLHVIKWTRIWILYNYNRSFYLFYQECVSPEHPVYFHLIYVHVTK